MKTNKNKTSHIKKALNQEIGKMTLLLVAVILLAVSIIMVTPINKKVQTSSSAAGNSALSTGK